MAKFLLGVIVGVVVAVLGVIIIGFALGRLFSSKQPVIAPNAVLVLALTGDVPESSPVDFSFNLGQSGTNPTVRDTWTSLRSAATDSKIKAVLLAPRGLTAGWAKLQELRRELLNFKKSGKPVYALLQGAGSREYYLSTAYSSHRTIFWTLRVFGSKKCISRTLSTNWASAFKWITSDATRMPATYLAGQA